MNTLQARVECMKLAAAICGSDRSADNVVKVSTSLYAWAASEEPGPTALLPSAERNPGSSPAIRKPKDKAKAP